MRTRVTNRSILETNETGTPHSLCSVLGWCVCHVLHKNVGARSSCTAVNKKELKLVRTEIVARLFSFGYVRAATSAVIKPL